MRTRASSETSKAGFTAGTRPQVAEQGSRNFAFGMFCVFVTSYFVHVTARLEILGALHFDMLLAAGTVLAIFLSDKKRDSARILSPSTEALNKSILLLLAYVILEIPFIQWPGSVLRNGLEPFAKALCFYFFIMSTVDTVKKLKITLGVYVGCQVFRALEPLYLHITTGYWGDAASLSNWTMMDRLAGSPYDIINSNGLGFVVVTTLPLLHYLCPPTTFLRKLLLVAVGGLMMYALILSASRSSFLALILFTLIVIARSQHRFVMLVAAAIVAVAAVSLMNDNQRDRYLSIVSHDTKSSGTAEGRVSGVFMDFDVIMRRPLLGHGLGTSREANANFSGRDQPSHDLYTEVSEELGFVGLFLYLRVIASIVRNCIVAKKATAAVRGTTANSIFLGSVGTSLLVLVGVYLFFSFASYGLSEPYWYVIGGLSAVAARLAVKQSAGTGTPDMARGARRSLRLPRPA